MADEDEEAPTPVLWSGVLDEAKLPTGEGTMTYPNGETFVGTVIAGKRTGVGKYNWPTKTVTDEESGKETTTPAAAFEGEYKEDIKDGQGAFSYPDGSKYEGGWVADQRSGEGTYTYANGDTFQGGWAAGVRSGKGVYFSKSSASQFEGVWAAGALVEGSWIMRDGSTFVGSFAGAKLKAGAYTFMSTGNTQTGKFNADDTFTPTTGIAHAPPKEAAAA